MSNNLARTGGRMECDVARGSGLARRDFRLHLVTNQTNNVNARPIGGAASAAVTTWTTVTVNNKSNPFCGTLVALITQTSATTGTLRLRVRGYDQFGEWMEELTPVVSLVAKTNNYVYLAKTFAYVEEVAFQSTGLDIAGDTISVGQRWDWTRTIDGTNEHLAGRNLGFPIPLRSGRVPGNIARGPNQVQQRIGPTLVGANPAAGGTETTWRFNRLREEFPERVSEGYFSLAGGVAPSNNDTFTINGVVYTWKTTLTGAANEVLIGGSGNAALQNMRAAINGAGGQAGVVYGTGTVANTSVEATIIGAVGSNPFLRIISRAPGTYGLTITVAESGAVTSWSTANLIAGFDAPLEVLGLTVMDLTGLASAGAIVHVRPDQMTVGLNEAGWAGPVEKIHFLSPAVVAQWAITDDILVGMQVLTADDNL